MNSKVSPFNTYWYQRKLYYGNPTTQITFMHIVIIPLFKWLKFYGSALINKLEIEANKRHALNKLKQPMPLQSQCDWCLFANEIGASSQMKSSMFIVVIFSSPQLKSKLVCCLFFVKTYSDLLLLRGAAHAQHL